VRLAVDPSAEVDVHGYAGEPFLRFSRTGVQINTRSATAQGLRLAPSGPIGADNAQWKLLTGASSFAWADTRVWAPASALHGRKTLLWRLPIVVAGRPAEITGELTRVAEPPVWPWLVLTALLLLGAVAAARRKRWVWAGATGLAAVAGLATAANMSGFALGGLPVSADRWVLFATEVGLTFAALAALTRVGTRLVAVAALSAFSVLQSLSELAVFRHGVVVSGLPPSAVRVAAAIGLGAGLGAAGLVFATPTQTTTRRSTRRNPKHLSVTRPFRKEQA
jgi:hypothetical protein